MHRYVDILAGLVLAFATANRVAASPLAPEVVQQQAQAYAATHPDAPRPNSGRSLGDEYAYWFFQGFTHPGGVQTRLDIIATAYGSGQAYRRDHPDSQDEILAGYGYVRVMRDGALSLGFERSSFTPLDAGSEHWWFSTFGGRRWSELRPGQADPVDGAHVRVEGYLSSTGRFGHLGAYSRELLVTSFEVLQP
jgi:hypothetical protein